MARKIGAVFLEVLPITTNFQRAANSAAQSYGKQVAARTKGVGKQVASQFS